MEAVMRRKFIALCISLLCAAAAAPTQAAVSVSIGINVPAYPQMVVVPGYPVYYAPALGANFFFYDGMYWVFEGDSWYMSSWYNGPWVIVQPAYVPYYVLRVPVRYYAAPPPYFRGWQPSAPPRWGQRWGPQWEQQHHGWDNWNRHAVPAPAPLPTYQRRYSGDRYPSGVQQMNLQNRNYHYQPRSEVAREHVQQQQAERRATAPAQAPVRAQPEHGPQAAPQRQQGGPMVQQEPRGQGPQRHEAAPRQPPQQMQQQPQQMQQQPPHVVMQNPQQPQQGRAEPQQERGRGKGHAEGKDKREEGGQGPGR
jgi:hypothetical protein